MILPDPFKFESLRDYFTAFVTENKKKNAYFSYEFLAEKLEWPRALVGDIRMGRKNLSIRRALEFATYFKLDALTTERLIYLILRDGLPSHTDQLNKLFNPSRNDFEVTQLPPVLPAFGRAAKTQAVFELIRVVGRELEAAQISAILAGVADLTEEVAKESLDWLKSSSYLKFDQDKKAIFSKDAFFLDEFFGSGFEVHIEYAKNIQTFCQAKIEKRLPGPSAVNTLYLQIPKDRFELFRSKLLGLRNWFLSFEKGEGYGKEVYICQIDLNLFPIVDTDALAKIASTN